MLIIALVGTSHPTVNMETAMIKEISARIYLLPAKGSPYVAESPTIFLNKIEDEKLKKELFLHQRSEE